VGDGYFLVSNEAQVRDIEEDILRKHSAKIIFSPAVVTINSLVEQLTSKRNLSEVRKQLILTDIIKKNNYFGDLNDTLSIYEAVSDIIREIRNYCIDSQKLFSVDKTTKIIAEIVAAYEQKLMEEDFYDVERMLQEANPETNLEFLILDGFDSLSQLQKVFLGKIFQKTEDIYISINYDRERPELFKDALELRDYLVAMGFEEEYYETSYLSKELAVLEGEFLKKEIKQSSYADNVGILKADNIQLEYELIAKEMMELYKTGRYVWSDFVLVFRQINEKRYLIQNVFHSYGIPVVVHEGLYLWRSSFLKWLLTLYQLALDGFTKEVLLEFLKQGYLDISYKDLNYLERLFDRYPFSQNYQDIAEFVQNKNIQKILRQVKLVVDELESCNSFKQQWKVLNDYCLQNNLINSLKNDLRNIGMQEYARENLKAYARLKAYYQDLNEEIPAIDDFRKSYIYIEHFLTQNIVRIDKYPSDRVQVLDAPSARQKRFKVLFIADMVFGSYPLPQLNRTLIDNQQRQQVGLRSFLDRQEKENVIFYQLLSRADDRIYFCNYRYTLYGAKVTPSIYLDWVNNNCEINPHNIKNKKYSDIFTNIEDLSSREYKYALANYLYSNFPDYPDNVDEKIDSSDLDIIQDLIQKRVDLRQQRYFSNKAWELLQQQIATLSVTSLENYDRCPFMFFCRYLLKIKTADEFSIYAYRGSVVHKVLELFMKEHAAEEVDFDQLENILEPLLEAELSELKQRYPEEYYLAEKSTLLSKLKLFLTKMLTDIATDELLPTKYEYQIEEGDFIFEGINIKGKVDRIDENEKEFRVIDYKTGKVEGNKDKLDQILLYTLILNETNNKNALDPKYLKFPSAKDKEMSWDKEQVQSTLKKVIGRIKDGDYYRVDKSCENNSFKQCAFINICSKIRDENHGN